MQKNKQKSSKQQVKNALLHTRSVTKPCLKKSFSHKLRKIERKQQKNSLVNKRCDDCASNLTKSFLQPLPSCARLKKLEINKPEQAHISRLKKKE